MATRAPTLKKANIRQFAEGGKPESSEELMARIAAKYGVTAAPRGTAQEQAPQRTVPVTTPQPAAKTGIADGIRGIFDRRKEQIDKAAGYAGGRPPAADGITANPVGAKVEGPGTSTSDSIPAVVHETGEPIRIANKERIVSAEQDQFLEGVAMAAGYKNLDAMLEDGTGKPVGPTIKAGKRAAADGMAPELDPFAYRGGPAAGITVAPGADAKIQSAIAAPPSLGSAPFARSEPAGTLTGPAAGINVGPDGEATPQPVSKQGGVIDDSASAKRDWESSGRYTPQKQLETMQRNRMMSDLTDPTITDLAVRVNAAKALGVMNQSARDSNPLDLELKQQRINAGATANAEAEQLATLHQRYLAETDPTKQTELADQISVINGKGHGGSGVLTLPQQRSNAEIDAARARIAGLTPDEIKRKTANYTATGRENPEYDQTLAKAVSLANRRKVGADDHFDQRQQAQPPAGNDGDVMTRFRGDAGMKGYKTGQMTGQGLEVFDATGRLVGHYR